jgi:hypothetical protein
MYERLVGESGRAYAAFSRFRDMDPDQRGLHAAYRRHTGAEAALLAAREITDPLEQAAAVEAVNERFSKRASGRWQEWYTHFAWADRARAFDEEDDRRQLAHRFRERRQLRTRKVNYGRLLVGRAVPALNGIQPQNLNLEQALTLLTVGLKLESEGLGDSLEVPEGAVVARQEESYVDRIHRLKRERGLVLLDAGAA